MKGLSGLSEEMRHCYYLMLVCVYPQNNDVPVVEISALGNEISIMPVWRKRLLRDNTKLKSENDAKFNCAGNLLDSLAPGLCQNTSLFCQRRGRRRMCSDILCHLHSWRGKQSKFLC